MPDTEEYTIVEPGEDTSVEEDDSSSSPPPSITEGGEEIEEVEGDEGEEDDSSDSSDSSDESSKVDLAELSDDEIDTLIEAYQDKILNSPKLEEKLQEVVKGESARLAEQTSRSREVEQELGVQIQHGRIAVKNMADFAAVAMEQLKKAAEGEPFETNIFNPDAFIQNLQAYGNALSNQRTALLTNAATVSIEALVGDALPDLDYDQAQELADIFNAVENARKNPELAANADAYLIYNLMQFVAKSASGVGAQRERQRQEAIRKVSDKVTQKNAVAVASAKLAKQKNPPAVGGKVSSTNRYTADLEGYRKAKADGNTAAAEAISERIARYERENGIS